jgi:hypothetical protein
VSLVIPSQKCRITWVTLFIASAKDISSLRPKKKVTVDNFILGILYPHFHCQQSDSLEINKLFRMYFTLLWFVMYIEIIGCSEKTSFVLFLLSPLIFLVMFDRSSYLKNYYIFYYDLFYH